MKLSILEKSEMEKRKERRESERKKEQEDKGELRGTS